jgi:hypothetical protein
MALRNPYAEYARRGDENTLNRDALIQALEDSPDQPPPMPMQARPRAPTRPPQQTREMLGGPGGQTQVDRQDGTNPYGGGGDRFTDEEPDVYRPPPPSPAQTGAQPRETDSFRSNPQRGSSLLDAYDDPYTRRNEGPGGALSNAARWGQTGATVGSVVPGVGTLVGGVVGGVAGLIGGALTKNAKTAMTDFRIEDARQIISQAYKDALGRDITPEALDEIVRGQGWEPGDRWMGEASLRYVLDTFAHHAELERAQRETQTETAPAPTTTTPTGATPGGAGAPGGLPFEGFDFGAQDAGHERGNSAKYSYAAAVREAPPLTDTSKGGYEAWVREHIAPRMEADGHRITAFEGDRFKVESASGSGWVDGLRGAGGDRPGFAWQPDDVGGATAGGGLSGSSGATSIQSAYEWLKQNADPSWTREEMQAAINAAFADVPGFVEGYAGDAVFDNGKLDLITNFEGPGASWSDNLSLIPLHGGGSPAGASGGGTTTGLNLAPGASLAAPLGNSDVYAQVQAAIQRLMNGTSTRDELLGALGG